MLRSWTTLLARLAGLTLLVGGLALLGCPQGTPDDDDDDNDDASGDDDSATDDDDATADDDDATTDDDDDDQCTAQDLCQRTVVECEGDMTMQECIAWYNDPANCSSMGAYIQCNCHCLDAAACPGYFSCGENCFNNACGE